MIDPVLMKNDLLRSIWYLHMQPPGYNLAVGLIVKLFPDHYATVLWVAQLLMGAAIADFLFRLLRWLDVPAAWSCLLASLFIISPGCVLFENDATYEYPVLFFLLLCALALARFVERPAARWALAFFGCLLILLSIRNAFHILYILAVALGLLWILPGQRRAILIGALPAVLLAGGIYLKNGILFDRFTASTWGGMTLGTVMTSQISDEEAQELVKRGVASPLATIEPFSELDKYDPYIRRAPRTGIPILDQDVTSTGHPNFNNLTYLPIQDRYLADSLSILRHYPIAYVRSELISWFSYFLPASDMAYFRNIPAAVNSWDRGFDAVVFGQFRRTDDGEDLLELLENGHTYSCVLYTGMFLIAIIPATVAWTAAQFLEKRRRRGWTHSQLTVLAFMLFTIVVISLESTLFSTFDGNRYRFPLDGFFVALFGAMLFGRPAGADRSTKSAVSPAGRPTQ